MLWEGITLDSRTPLHVFEIGSVTGVREEVTEPYVGLFRGACVPEFLLMDDNVHRALLVDEFLESGDIHHMDWSSRSPDFNPIEHILNIRCRLNGDISVIFDRIMHEQSIEEERVAAERLKTGKQFLKVEMPRENFWRRPGPIQDCRASEENYVEK
ncbi:transposable element Tcb2 transposase [Trichonephila clavipes]|nr:transposable element Tcb2 transposase [Trichonephila clavipes]